MTQYKVMLKLSLTDERQVTTTMYVNFQKGRKTYSREILNVMVKLTLCTFTSDNIAVPLYEMNLR
jgi:hypothetical protein